MKHLFTLLLLFSVSVCFGQATTQESDVQAAQTNTTHESLTQSKVYVCDSKTAKAYYSSEGCRGLGMCTHGIVGITKKEAEEEYGRIPCQICY